MPNFHALVGPGASLGYDQNTARGVGIVMTSNGQQGPEDSQRICHAAQDTKGSCQASEDGNSGRTLTICDDQCPGGLVQKYDLQQAI